MNPASRILVLPLLALAVLLAGASCFAWCLHLQDNGSIHLVPERHGSGTQGHAAPQHQETCFHVPVFLAVILARSAASLSKVLAIALTGILALFSSWRLPNFHSRRRLGPLPPFLPFPQPLIALRTVVLRH